MLRGVPCATNVVEWKLAIPRLLNRQVSEDEKKKCRSDLEIFTKADNNALLAISTHMTKDNVKKEMLRFIKARFVWLELHRFLDANEEGKKYVILQE